MASNGSKPYKTQPVKLNAQWLKSAAKSLGMNGISTLEDISPNIAGITETVGNSVRTATQAASSIRRTNRPLQYLLEQNKYIKLGKRGMQNALTDLRRGNFNNTKREMQSLSQSVGGTDTSTYFGDFDDEITESTDPQSSVTQHIYQTDSRAINGVSDSIRMQTRRQLEVGKAHMDTMVALTSSTMTQNQRNSDAAVRQLSDISRGIQSLVAYNNENMSKYISSSLVFFENVGKRYGDTDQISRHEPEKIDPTRSTGGLNISQYKELVKKQFKETIAATPLREFADIVDQAGDDLVANPWKYISKGIMSKAVPKAVKAALQTTDKVFGSFMSEMLLQLGDKWGGSTDTGIGGTLKRLLGKTFNIRENRKTDLSVAGRLNTDAATFDKITRSAITDEIPKYLRESTSHLKSIVKLLGGDTNKAINDSEILNRETGRYQSYQSYGKDLMESINSGIISAMNSSDFGKAMKSVAAGLNENDQDKYIDALNKFYIAAEKNNKGSIDINRIGTGSDIDDILNNANIDDNMKRVLTAALRATSRNQNGAISFNESRNRAKIERNRRLMGIEENDGISRVSNFLGREKTFDEVMASVLYGNHSGKVSGRTTVAVAPTSLVGKLDSIEGLLNRGINVKILSGEPFHGRASNLSGGAGRLNTPRARRAHTPTPGNPEDKSVSEMSDEELRNMVDESTRNPDAPEAKGSASKFFVDAGKRARNAMYYVMQGNLSLAQAEMSALTGSTWAGVRDGAKRKVIDPLKEKLLGKDEYDENGNKIKSTIKVSDVVKKNFGDIATDIKKYLFGDAESGNGAHGVGKAKGLFKQGFEDWRKVIFGDKDPKEVKEKMQQSIQERMPSTIKGAVTGGILGTLVGGPIAGALIGSAAGFTHKSKTFQKIVFGNIVDDDGNVVDRTDSGILSQKMQKYFKDNKADIIGGGTIGSLTGAITGGGILGNIVGGPLAGALMGTGIALFRKSKNFQEMLYGKDDPNNEGKKIGGIINSFNAVMGKTLSDNKGNLSGKKLTGMTLVGSGTGLLAGMFTPLGPIGGAILGAGASMLASKDKFRELLFGKEDESGKKEPGLLKRMGITFQANLLDPLLNTAKDFMEESKEKVIDKVLAPFMVAIDPMLQFTKRIYESTLGKVTKKLHEMTDSIKTFFGGLMSKAGKTMFGWITKPFKWLGKTLFDGAVGAGTGVLGKAISTLGNKATKSNQKASLKRFNKENLAGQHADLIDGWRKQYADNSDLHDVSEENYIQQQKQSFYYSGKKSSDSNERNNARANESMFGTREDRIQRSKEREERSAERKQLQDQSRLIATLTGGRTKEVTDESKLAALNAYKSSRSYERGKGTAGFNADEIFKLLEVRAASGDEEGQKKDEERDKAAREQLEIQKENLPLLGKIDYGIQGILEAMKNLIPSMSSNVAESIQEGRRQSAERRARYQEAFDADDSDEVAIIREGIHNGTRYSGNEWSDREDEIREGLRSHNRTTRRAARNAASIFFDSRGRRIPTTETERDVTNEERSRAYDEFRNASGRIDTERRHRVNSWQAARMLRLKERLQNEGVHGTEDLESRSGNATQALRNEYGAERGYASGGNTKKGLAVVGERGPEVVKFSGGQKVYSGQSAISVIVENIGGAAKKVLGERRVQDVNIIGQTGPLTTYGTAARLGSNTDNSMQIEKALKAKDSLVSYDDIKADNNDDADGSGSKKPKKESLLSKLFGGDGGFLGGIKNIAALAATAFGAFKLLQSDKVQDLISNIGGAVKDTGENIAWTATGSNYEGGKNTSANAKAQVNRLSSIAKADAQTFMLGEDHRYDGMTESLMTGMRVGTNKLLNGSAGKRGLLSAATHPLRTISTAVRHPFRTAGAVSSGLKNVGNAVANFAKADSKSAFLKGAMSNAVKGSTSYNQINMVKGLLGSKSFAEASDVVSKSMTVANPQGKGIAGKLQKFKDWSIKMYGKVGGKAAGEATSEVGEAIAREGIEKIAKEGAEEAVEGVAKKAVQTVATEGAEAASKKGMLKTVGVWLKKAADMVVDALSKKMKGSSNKIITKLVSVFDNVIEKISKGLVGKLKGWITKKLQQMMAVITGTVAVAATGVGALAVLAKNGVFFCLGALNSAGKGGTARLFRCQQSDVDWKMRAISSAIGALVQTTPGCIVDIANEIYCALTGDDVICNMASVLYKWMSNDDDDAKLEKSQENHKKEYESYKETQLQTEWKSYLEDNSLTAKDISFDQYKSGIEKGEIKSDIKGFDEWNDSVNQTFGSKIWKGITDTSTKAWDGIKSGASKAWGWLTGNESEPNPTAVVSSPDTVETSTQSGKGGGKGGGRTPFYSQKDPRWANNKYQSDTNSDTMSDAGCGPTAVAMAVSGTTGRRVLPTESAKVLQSVGARDNTGTNWKGIGKAATVYGLTSAEATNPNASFVDSAVNSGKPVIVSGSSSSAKSPYTPEGHYVVVTGKDRNGNYIVNDPNSLRGSRAYSKNALMKDTAKAWKFGGKGPATASSSKTTQMPTQSMADQVQATQQGAMTYNGNAPQLSLVSQTNESTGTGVTASDVISVAMNEVGYLEKASNNALESKTANAGKSNFTKYGAFTKTNGHAWCASFVSWCLYQASNSNESILNTLIFGGKSAACATLESQFKKAGRFHNDTPAPGDLIFFTTSRSNDGKAHHIGIVVASDSKKVYTIEGNTSAGDNTVIDNGEGVAKKEYSLSYKNIRGYGRPLYDGTSSFRGVVSSNTTGSSLPNSSATTSSTSTPPGGKNILSSITSWITELGSRAMSGISTGEWNTDWSSWVSEQNGEVPSSASESSYPAASGGTKVAKSISSGSNADQIYKYFKSKGYGDAAIAGMMGNFMQESGLDPRRKQYPSGPGRGLAQWSDPGPRWKALSSMAVSNGQSPDELSAQMAFVDHEMNNDGWVRKNLKKHVGTLDDFKKLTNVDTATNVFEKSYEAAGKPNMAKRISHANTFYDQFKSSEGQAVASPGSVNSGDAGGGYGSRRKYDDNSGMTRLYTKDATSKGKTPDEYLVEEGDITVKPASMTSSARPTGPAVATSTHPVSGGRGIASVGTPTVKPSGMSSELANQMVSLLREIANTLSSSSIKLDNLELLSNIGSSNNIVAVNANNTTSSTSKGSAKHVETKTTSRQYQIADRISMGGA